MLDHKMVNRIAFMRVIVFAFSAFIFNTTEFIPVAILSDIAQGFDMPVSQVGLMITVYAWIVSLMSLPFMLLTAKLERRSLLIKLFILFIASHILSAVAWNFWVLLLARAGVAMAHAIFWSITASLVVRVAPRDKKSQALGLLAMGTALAMVLGLPLGRIIGQLLGWRMTFGLIGIMAFVVMIFIFRLLPNLPAKNTGSLSSIPTLMKRPLLMGLYALTIVMVSAHFTAYSYVEPFAISVSKMTATQGTALLLVFGVSGVVASLLFNRFHRLGPNKFLMLMMLHLLVGLALLLPLSDNIVAMFLLIFVWGIGISGIGLVFQLRVLQYAPDATDVAMSIFSGIYNIGIGGGALIGNLVMHNLGITNVGYVGGGLAAVGIIMFLYIHFNYQKIK
ncbi:DHA1 family L-arabinose/isopropyl-beta-D-thiogalactopyranoside export protein-like MFS transporter [Cricetibacter osteomyelitidis]|uniref:Probable sugar efflux transporter n=1 Tax=Cricetibacter osteomyelitidis TaxID=1521931 RepID=A0A4R2SN20_9PAST|nr:sugar transporter [Cricetibacter osteomyelitidis]TCP89771.1 DHA1 family L-arabinose/isopropyl-beta-D-thiogalactopyranoside export protein-like MFS transporter [Cricetibacter osteomyelitidis]